MEEIKPTSGVLLCLRHLPPSPWVQQPRYQRTAPRSILSPPACSPSILLLCPCSGWPGLAAPRLVAGAAVGVSAWQHQSAGESGTDWVAWGRLWLSHPVLGQAESPLDTKLQDR